MKNLYAAAAIGTLLSALSGCISDSSGSEPAEIISEVQPATATLQVDQVWDMPGELDELSGNVLIDDTRMACVQDNEGTIYIYNLQTKSVEDQIRFSGAGDYEGLTVVGDTYYVLRSDGHLSEVRKRNGSNPLVNTYDLPLDVSHDNESLFYDAKNKRLLIGTKEKGLTPGDGKGVYAFDLATKKMSTNAVYKIAATGNEDQGNGDGGGDGKKNNGKDSKKKSGKKNKGTVKPSEIAIHPQTGDLYILNGPQSQLLIADAEGQINTVMQLDKKMFPQPEGMSFTRSGELYISSEKAKNNNAIIAKVKL